MNVLLKKVTSLLLAIALVPLAAFSAAAAPATVTPKTVQNAVKVEYNKKQIAFPDQAPIINQGRTLVPIRPIAESLGFEVKWNEQTRTVTINKGKDNIRLVVTQKIANKNGQTINLDVPAQIVNKRTVVPVRFIAEALSYKVEWDPNTQTVLIADNVNPNQVGQQEKPKDPTKPATDEKKTEQVALIDKESIEGKSTTIAVIGLYRVTGKVDPKADLTVVIEDDTHEVEVNADGTFKLQINGDEGIRSFTVKAEKDGKQDTFEGEFISID
ncbi:copper amine oxidase N-terminal domain-containing protein [Brevibacillus formosus]|nr:copper amine oxidase N-terminal domain-containing protein [Brevibacillus sp. NRRL NRS-603]MED1943305.1 copper amine oxidase N-terminal domain-containing protein [Brevibacillus formosus]MED2000323.1 copper amine oxidase N-terminal domain-containing protein [Brevibacillus formosus]MED2082976.1 copper amine oxidase N-terminal domain-containing protein [Brevibacillus formosus]